MEMPGPKEEPLSLLGVSATEQLTSTQMETQPIAIRHRNACGRLPVEVAHVPTPAL